MLQKVLQLYASRVLSKRSYAKKGITLSEFTCNVKQSDFVAMEILKAKSPKCLTMCGRVGLGNIPSFYF
jgi:hypothetical protein